MHQNVAVIIPAYNESTQILDTLNLLKPHFSEIYIIDDGSTDYLSKVVENEGVTCLRHPINLGQGAAIQTGIDYALKQPKIEYLLTFDADGQHSISDALNLVKAIKENEVDIVLGSRFLHESSNSDIPQKKRMVLRLGIIFTRFDTGLKVTDTHNGLRIMSRNFAETLNLRHPGMAHASEIISHIKETEAKWIEHPVKIHYHEYAIKKGQSIFNAINILTEMLHR